MRRPTVVVNRRTLMRDEIQHVRMPKGFVRALWPVFTHGTTRVATDVPIPLLTTGTAMTVVTKPPPGT